MDSSALEVFSHMCHAVGDSPSNDQINRLVSYAVEKFGRDEWPKAKELALIHGIGGLYTELSMRDGELCFF